MSDTVRVIIADDHPVVRNGINGILAAAPGIELLAEASNGREAVDFALEHKPDVVLMDLQMPELDGVAATGQLTEKLPATHVLILTTYDTDADIQHAIDAGAIGYLLKDAPHEEIIRAIRAAASGESTLAPAITQRLVARMRGATNEQLTPREIEVLEHVARGRTNSQIANELFVSATTIKAHLAHIYRKLDVNDRTAAVTRALERNIIRLND